MLKLYMVLFQKNVNNNFLAEKSVVYTCIVSSRPHQCTGAGVHGFQLNGFGNDVIGTHCENLISSHEYTVGLLFSVEEDFDVSHSTLLPLAEIMVKPVEFGPPFEQDLLILFPRLHLQVEELN